MRWVGPSRRSCVDRDPDLVLNASSMLNLDDELIHSMARERFQMDDDLTSMTREALAEEVRRLRAGIRVHRDTSMHELCWHHPQLWGLLPEKIDPEIAVPEWPQFLRGCIQYRQS